MTAALWSLGEIEALARKAARGAGYEWGLAEESGAAVRWLAARQLAGVEALAALLPWRAARGPTASCIAQDVRTAPEAVACPIATGALLCDGAIGLRLSLPCVKSPLLMLPFVSWHAVDLGRALTATLGRAPCVTLPAGGVRCATDQPFPLLAAIEIAAGVPTAPPPELVATYRATADAAAVDLLQEFARRTYAPATEESRVGGAGPGLRDND